jgi:hypothetical protein
MFHAITMVEIFPPTHCGNVSDPHTGGNVFISSLEKNPIHFFSFLELHFWNATFLNCLTLKAATCVHGRKFALSLQ